MLSKQFGGYVSRIAPVTTKRFSSSTLEVIDQLPEIDLVLITHDHYDHSGPSYPASPLASERFSKSIPPVHLGGRGISRGGGFFIELI